MEARCTGAKRDGRLVWRRLAAHGSSTSLVEESAQGGDLEERVERHVVYARASGRVSVISAWASGQASLRAGEGLVGYVVWCRSAGSAGLAMGWRRVSG